MSEVDLPRLKAIPAEFGDQDLDFGEEFEFGLQRVLDGLELYLNQRK